ncbi:MAG: fumarylacetoacetate hydrolase family protein [Acidimicrobiales bacterium]
MRLVSIRDEGIRTGLVVGDEIVDLTDPAIGFPGDMPALLALDDVARDVLARAPAMPARRLPVVNDVSVRDWQWRSPTMMMGKSFDTHGPTGPWIITRDEVGDPQCLPVRTSVNGGLRPNGTTADMIFICAETIEHLSAVFTLLPGMLISTGTPAGVAAGQDPPRWLKAGDTVTVSVGPVGELSNPVTDEPDPGPERAW